MIGAAIVLIVIIFNPAELRMKCLFFHCVTVFSYYSFVVVVALIFSVLWSDFCNPLSICSLFKAWLTGLLGCSFDLFSCVFFHT